MVIWKLTYKDNNEVQYYGSKKELYNGLDDWLDRTDKNLYEIQKVSVKTKWDLVFELKIAQGLKIATSRKL